MSVVNFTEFKEKRLKEKAQKERDEAIKRILARCPVWPGDPPKI